MGILSKIFGEYSKKEIRRLLPMQKATLALEDEYAALSDADLQAKTSQFQKRLADGESLDSLLPEAFATCREAAWRVLGMKHFPVQVLGGIVLHQGRIAEMKTGEGKTLVATLPAYLNALTGEGVHIVTVNDYLARRDSEWMGKIHRFLGLSVGIVYHELDDDERRAAYACDITYGTNNELGFDYLRDNMVQYQEQKVQRGHTFAIVDEVDSILIDEARTPLIISGRGDKSTELYSVADRFVKSLKCLHVRELDSKVDVEDTEEGAQADYVVDDKARSANLTAKGVKKAEAAFNVENLMDAENMTLQHHLNIAIRANGVMRLDVDYVVREGEVLIVDEFTGRIMQGRRYSEGLHQAIEAKEGVKVEHESKTLATITFQNYFRLYKKLSGMTGTAMTESPEFQEIYSLDVVEIPTNMPMVRADGGDELYRTEVAKFNAVIEQVLESHAKGQPVLVGTISIEKSEQLSKMLKKRGIKHEVLNAKFHEKEAEIVAQAGMEGAVTIATNMAGRGTDIMLGGNAEYLAKQEMRRAGFSEELISEATAFGDTEDEDILHARETFHTLEKKHKEAIKAEADRVREAGGLFIIGTERHESRRIDNQLRGRSGRQGDPGESRFYLSAEDDMLRRFAGDRFHTILTTFKQPDDMPLSTGVLTKLVESAQKKLESQNFASRKHVVQYDDVMNRQREVIYKQRDTVLAGESLKPILQKMIADSLHDAVAFYCPASLPREEWNLGGLKEKYNGWLLRRTDDLTSLSDAEILTLLSERATERYEGREKEMGEELFRGLERMILLGNVDSQWMDYIDAMEELKQGIGLRAYGQTDPVVAFRKESFDMFDDMTDAIREETVRQILTVVVRDQKETERKQKVQITEAKAAGGDDTVKARPVRKSSKPGPNDPCHCGSGKKYKKCHMLEDQATK
ncbi:MAG: preprotein translocase subunit SecA [Oscillospiraceae bacterium]|jgi:preprotein translocase subunit SecA|nr:preprotein translocase subunit SecA [Oscillospiraceae bacterium]